MTSVSLVMKDRRDGGGRVSLVKGFCFRIQGVFLGERWLSGCFRGLLVGVKKVGV